MKYDDLSKQELIERIEALESKEKGFRVLPEDYDDVLQDLSLHREELRVQNEELKIAQQDLERTRRKYLDLFDYAPVGYITLSRQGVILESNQTFARMIGVDKKAAVNKPVMIYLTKDFMSYPAMLPEWVEKSGSASKIVKLQPRESGPIWVQLIATRSTTEKRETYNVAVQDISRLVEAEERLEDAYTSMQLVLDNIPSIVGIVNESGHIELVNNAWRSFVNRNFPRIDKSGIGYEIYDFFKAGFAKEVTKNKNALAELYEMLEGKNGTFDFECPFYAEGKKRWFQMRAGRYLCKEGPKVVITFDDISEVKNSQVKIRKERDRFDEILSALNTGLRIIKPDMSIGWVNAKTREMFPGPDLIGKQCHEIFGGKTSFCNDCATKRSFEQGCSSTTEHFHYSHKKWFSVYTVPIVDDKGKVVRVLESITDVSRQKETEQHLKQSEYRYRSLFRDNSVIMFLVNPVDGKLIDVNKAAEHFYGWSRAQMQEKSVYDINTMTREELEAEITKNLRLDKKTFHFKHRTASGEIKQVEVHSGPIMVDGRKIIHSTIIDVTDRKRNELELLRLRRSVENSFASIVITDLGGNIVYVNPAFSKITGYSIEESIGKNTRVLKSGVHSDDFYRDMWRTIIKGKTWRGEICNRKKDGSLFWEQATISPVTDKKGRTTNYVAVKDDITERKELERLKEDVERVMHHDLKNPLNGIIGLPEILKLDADLSPSHLQIVDMIEKSGHRMLRMIDSSLNIFKMENKTYNYSPRIIDINSVFREILDEVQSKCSAKSLEVVFKGNTSGSFDVLAEYDLLYGMLSNIVINSIEASPMGENVVVDLPLRPDNVLKIINKGAVPLEVRADFFEKYKTHGKKSGTGIGTYSSKLIADTMGFSLKMNTSDEEDMTVIEIGIVYPDIIR